MPSFSSSGSSLFSMPWKRRQSYELNSKDAEYNAIYLGSVWTVMAKGEGSIEKPMNVIWRSYNAKKQLQQHHGASFGDITMKLTVTRSGLKIETKQLGVSDYWAHRITFCAAPANYPKVFCWVYKHEGKRMKSDLRCHAILCRKSTEPKLIVDDLQLRLRTALLEYKREKLAMEKARKTSICSTGVIPRRRLLLQTGALHFRPLVSRSRSVPRLNSIDEEEEPPVELEKKMNEDMDDELFAQGSDTDSISYNYRNTPMIDGDETSPDEDNHSSTSGVSSRSKRSGSDVYSGGSASNDSGFPVEDLDFSTSFDESVSCRSEIGITTFSTAPSSTNSFANSAPPGSLNHMFNEYLVV